MVDRDHNPVNRAYNLMDRRATSEVAWLKQHVGEDRMFLTSAYRVEDHPNLVNLLWEKRNRPDDYARIWKALTIDGFVALRLTGSRACTTRGRRSTGSRSTCGSADSTRRSWRRSGSLWS